MKKILVIEDSKQTRKHLVEIIKEFEDIKCKVHEAEDGLEGIRKAKKLVPDVIFMDIVLPYISGYAASVRLRKIEELKHTVIVGMTADIEDDTRGKVLAWCDAFIPKPIDKKKIFRLLKKYLVGLPSKAGNGILKRRKEDIKTQLTSDIVEQLESRVVELETAKLRIKRLNELKAQMMDLLSHEIKTPLTAIVGYGECLKMSAKECMHKDVEDMIDKINESSRRISNLISEINSLNRLKFSVKAGAETVLKVSVIRIFEKRQAYIKEKNLKLVIGKIPDDLKLPVTDSYFDEFFDHIIKNAIIYNSDNGEIIVNVTPRGHVVKIEVKDTGPGFPKELTEFIFNPLTQSTDVEHHKSHPLRGLGMGLAICREMIENVGGQIELKNRVSSEGSVVTIKLPVKE